MDKEPQKGTGPKHEIHTLIDIKAVTEKQLNNALRGMSFAPDQAPYHIREVNRALAMRKKLEVVS